MTYPRGKQVDPEHLDALSSPAGHASRPDDAGPTPALDLLVGRAPWASSISMGIDNGTPGSCPGCPFVGRSIEPYEHIWNDLTEAYYPCGLLREVVWGEYSPCELSQWQARAQEELAALETRIFGDAEPGTPR